MKTVKEIRMEFDSAPVKKWRELYEIYGKDERQGVRKLLEQYRKKEDRLEAEMQRMEQMMQYEKKYEHLGYI